MPADTITQDDLWDTLCLLGTEADTVNIEDGVLVKLIECEIAKCRDDGWLALTPYGKKCFVTMESGDGPLPEFNDDPPADA